MLEYLNLLNDVLKNGEQKSDRTGTGTLSVFGRQIHINLTKGFPLLTTKKLHLKSIIYELLWFLMGETNIGFLKENNVSIWDAWADSSGNLGPIYGKQWRSWTNRDGKVIDQISLLLKMIRTNPSSRRLIVSSWNVGELEEMALAPCHCFFQFYINNNKLSCQLYQRSADLFLGVPFNIASYSLLTMMIAQVCNLGLGSFIHTFGDLHIYNNHIEQSKKQVSRDPHPLPIMKINPDVKDLFAFKYSDFELVNYNPHSHIKAKVAV